jgi:DNA replication and repair protein RecF
MDDTLVALALKYDAMRLELDRVVRQRNTLLKQSRQDSMQMQRSRSTCGMRGSRRSGDQFGHARRCSCDASRRWSPRRTSSSPARGATELRYDPPWRRAVSRGARAARDDDVRARVSTVGPHRDDVEIVLDDMPARTHASQGEQRTLALALRSRRTGWSPRDRGVLLCSYWTTCSASSTRSVRRRCSSTFLPGR